MAQVQEVQYQQIIEKTSTYEQVEIEETTT